MNPTDESHDREPAPAGPNASAVTAGTLDVARRRLSLAAECALANTPNGLATLLRYVEEWLGCQRGALPGDRASTVDDLPSSRPRP